MTESCDPLPSTDRRAFDHRRLSNIAAKPLAIRELRSPERRNHATREELVLRVRSEFNEMHGLRITLQQAGRLFGLREDVCVRILGGLCHEGLLARLSDGRYGRKDVA